MNDDNEVTVSSGNVFTDIGMADAAEKKTKVQLAMAINAELAARITARVKTSDDLNHLRRNPEIERIREPAQDGPPDILADAGKFCLGCSLILETRASMSAEKRFPKPS